MQIRMAKKRGAQEVIKLKGVSFYIVKTIILQTKHY